MSDPRDDSITHVFDQTNGVIDDLQGESDGTAAGDTASAADRGEDEAVPGADLPQAYDGPRSASTVSSRDDAAGDEAERGDRRASTSDDAGGGAVDDAEHTYAVDSRGAATDTGSTADDQSDGAYSGAPAVAAQSAADDGRDEGSTRSERSGEPVDDASHTGRLADAYATGPADEVGSAEAEAPVIDPRADRDPGADVPAGTGDRTTDGVAAVAAGGGSSPTGADGSHSEQHGGLGRLDDDDSIGHVFDQTNGVIDGADGDSNGLAESDERSEADREGLNEPNPVGQQDAWHDDHYGESDGRDPNP